MSIFNKKSTNASKQPTKKQTSTMSNSGKQSGYICKKLFNISKPYGYNPQDVDEAISKYNDLLSKQKNIIIKLKNENVGLKSEIKEIETELHNMQMELSFATVPTVTEIQEKYILDNFKKSFASVDDKAHTEQNRELVQDSKIVPQQTAPTVQQQQQQQQDEAVYNDVLEEIGVDNSESSNNENENFDFDLLSNVVGETIDIDGDGIYDVCSIVGDQGDSNTGNSDQKTEQSGDDFLKNFKF
mgnify:CR=1 FL=1